MSITRPRRRFVRVSDLGRYWPSLVQHPLLLLVLGNTLPLIGHGLLEQVKYQKCTRFISRNTTRPRIVAFADTDYPIGNSALSTAPNRNLHFDFHHSLTPTAQNSPIYNNLTLRYGVIAQPILVGADAALFAPSPRREAAVPTYQMQRSLSIPVQASHQTPPQGLTVFVLLTFSPFLLQHCHYSREKRKPKSFCVVAVPLRQRGSPVGRNRARPFSHDATTKPWSGQSWPGSFFLLFATCSYFSIGPGPILSLQTRPARLLEPHSGCRGR